MFEPSPKSSVRETSESLQMEACGFYLALTRTVAVPVGPGEEPSLGGKLLYAGELEGSGRARVIAGNVAGCATLAATAEPAAQKQSIQDGVVDFLVTSLDEALRVLKNEVRQRKTVAVCAGGAPDAVEQEMRERGVQPDLVFAAGHEKERGGRYFGAGTREIQLVEPGPGLAFVTWRVEHAPARWMARLDSLALGCIDARSWESRWIRLSPRYLGSSGFGQRSVLCDSQLAKEILRRLGAAVRNREVDVEIAARLASDGQFTTCLMRPGEGAPGSFQGS